MAFFQTDKFPLMVVGLSPKLYPQENGSCKKPAFSSAFLFRNLFIFSLAASLCPLSFQKTFYVF